MVKQITPLSFTAAFTAKFSHHLSHTSLCYKLLNSGSRLHSNEHVNQWQSGAVEIMILSTSGRLYRSKSINHRAAFQRKRLNYCTCQIHCGQAEKLVFFFFFFILNALLNSEGLWSDFQSGDNEMKKSGKNKMSYQGIRLLAKPGQKPVWPW